MSEMEKDEKIERAFERYTGGGDLPQVDLSAAKAALTEARTEERRRAEKRRKVWTLAVSAAACLLFAVALAFLLLPFGAPDLEAPSGSDHPPAGESPSAPEHFSLLSATAESAGYSELESRCGSAQNASAQYTVYRAGGEDVLLSAELGYWNGMTKLKATVYVDLSAGKYLAEELEDYADLPMSRDGYRYEAEYIGGEYVSRALLTRGETYYVSMISHNADALGLLVKLLTE